MTRLLYRFLLWLHPPVFRREFAGEMLWIFESSVESEGSGALLADALRSLGRQWLLRSAAWKIAAALAGAAVQVGLAAVGIRAVEQRHIDAWFGAGALAHAQSHNLRFAPGLSNLVCATICLVPCMIIAILLLGIWTRTFMLRRMAGPLPFSHRRTTARP